MERTATAQIYPIENIPLFLNLPEAHLRPLREAAIRHLYKPGESIFSNGDLPEFLYIVEEGAVDIVLPAKGEDITLASFAEGSFFGVQIKNVNDMIDERTTAGTRVAELVARFGGSWTFIICFSVPLLTWAGANTAYVSTHPVDSYTPTYF